VAKLATVAFGIVAVLLGIVFKGQNVAFMVGLAFAVASSANFPALLLSVTWKNLTTKGATYSIYTGAILAVALIVMSPTVWVDIFHKTEKAAVTAEVKKIGDTAKAEIVANPAAKAEIEAKAAADTKAANAKMPKAIIPYKNPGIFSMGAAFLVAILFSLIGKPEANKDQRFEDEKIRTYLGIGAE